MVSYKVGVVQVVGVGWRWQGGAAGAAAAVVVVRRPQ